MSESMFSAALRHAAYRIGNAQVRRFPFDHIVVEDVWPEGFYELLLANLPENADYTRLVDTGRVGAGYSPERLSLMRDGLPNLSEPQRGFWEQVFDVMRDPLLFRAFATVFSRRLSQLRNDIGVRPEAFLMRDRAGYALGPHTDSPAKIVSVLSYLAGDHHPGLGTSIYMPKQEGFTNPGGPHLPREDFDLLATLPYGPNVLVAFPKTDDCFHGVEPVGTGKQRDILFLDYKAVRHE